MTVETEVTDAIQIFIEEAFPKGSLTLLLMPFGPEKEALLIPIIARAMKDKMAILVALSNIPPKGFLRKLASAGLKVELRLKKGRFKILDWYSHKEEDVKEVSEEGGILRCPGELEALEGALTQLLDSAKGKGVAILEILSDMAWTDEEKASKFIPTLEKKLRKAYHTSVVPVDVDLFGGPLAAGLEGVVDGVVEVARRRSEAGVTWRATIKRQGEEVAAYEIKTGPPFVEFMPMREEAIQAEVEVTAEETEEAAANPCPQCGAPLEEDECNVCGFTPEDSRLWKIKEIYERCEESLKEDPENLDALFTKAAALARMREYEAAVQTLNELTKHDARYPALWMLKAKIYDRLGDEVKANLCRQRALDLEQKEMGFVLEARVQPEGDRFQCPLCQRWLPMDATLCSCGAEFVEEEEEL
ncbi:MAG: tetratricopeptide repeat protein [Thermoplasmata archaeon]